MSTDIHTTYPNSTIVEAICELHFTCLKNPLNWDGKWYGRLHSKVGVEYEMEPKTAKGFMVQAVNQNRPSLSENQVLLNQMIYKHRTKNQLIQLAPWTLTVNMIGPYQGWNSFVEHIKHSWLSLSSIIDSVQVTRMGMRYINRIPKNAANEKVGEWFLKSDLLPERLLTQKNDYFFRCEIPQTENSRIIVTLTEEQTDLPIKPIIFDIDTFTVQTHHETWEQIYNDISQLHNAIRHEFDSSLTEKLKSYLNQTS